MRMKSILKKTIAFSLAITLLLSFAACKKKQPENSDSNKNFTVIENTDVVLAKNGKTDYRILISETADENIVTAADELGSLFYEATGASLSITTDKNAAYSADKKILSIGENGYSDSASVSPSDGLGSSGFDIVTKGNSVFMLGRTSTAAIYAVYDFLKYHFGFEPFTDADYVIDKTDVCTLKNIRARSVPSFDIRIDPMPMMWDINEKHMRRLRFSSPNDLVMRAFPTADQFATTFYYVSPTEYFDEHPEYFSDRLTSDGKPIEINFANRDVWDIALENIKKVIIANPHLDRLIFGQQDHNTWDESDLSKADIEKYGACSSSVVLCTNYLAQKVREWMAEEYPERAAVKIGMFAYNKSFDAPVKSDGKGGFTASAPEMMLDKDAFVIVAPIETDMRWGYDDPANTVINKNYADAIKGWSALGAEMFIWSYSIDFCNFFVPLNVYNTLQDRYRFFEQNNCSILYDQGLDAGSVNGTAFYELRHYLQSKLAWNVDADVNALISDFIKCFYGEAAEYMQEYFDRMIALTTYDFFELNMRGHVYENLMKASFWPKGELDEWLELFEKSYEAIEQLKETDFAAWEKLKNRLDKERISPLFLLIELHSGYYASNELLAMKYAVRDAADRNDIRTRCEFDIDKAERGARMTELYRYWGIL